MAAVIATERRLRTRMPGRELGHAQPSVVDVTLQFTESFGAAHECTVRVHYGISRILPRHILVARFRPRLIFLESVAVAITVFIDPRQARFGIR
jgi:hypothetical protein